MWILDFFPAAIFHLILTLGIVGAVASFTIFRFPVLNTYRIPLQVVSIAIVLFGMWIEGALSNQEEWKMKIAEEEKKVLIAERQAAEATGRVEIVYRDRIQVVKDVQVGLQTKIDAIASIIDSHCKITPEVVDILNSAAKNKVASP